ncbi:MAG: hypothetical protein QXO40_00090 [Candidatus Aenigmatarchaeota archaeon]
MENKNYLVNEIDILIREIIRILEQKGENMEKLKEKTIDGAKLIWKTLKNKNFNNYEILISILSILDTIINKYINDFGVFDLIDENGNQVDIMRYFDKEKMVLTKSFNEIWKDEKMFLKIADNVYSLRGLVKLNENNIKFMDVLKSLWEDLPFDKEFIEMIEISIRHTTTILSILQKTRFFPHYLPFFTYFLSKVMVIVYLDIAEKDENLEKIISLIKKGKEDA